MCERERAGRGGEGGRERERVCVHAPGGGVCYIVQTYVHHVCACAQTQVCTEGAQSVCVDQCAPGQNNHRQVL